MFTKNTKYFMENVQKRCYSIKITILIDQQNTSSVCLERINDIYYLIVLL